VWLVLFAAGKLSMPRHVGREGAKDEEKAAALASAG
jgi:hypothetical protein